MESFYFAINTAQHFSFPHSNADIWTDEQLWKHYVRPDYFTAYTVRTIDNSVAPETILSTLYDIPGFRAAAVAWMRLKFLCEVLEPVYILKKRNPRWRFVSELLTWTPEEVTERCASADICCNILGITLCELLYALTKGTEADTLKKRLAEWEPSLNVFNAAVNSIRASPHGECQWHLCCPRELVPLPWCTYIVNAYATLPPLLACLNPTAPSE
jgi:hypothetical protein